LAVCEALAIGAAGDEEGALAAMEAVLADAAAADDPVGRVWAANGRTHLLLRAGRVAEARAAFDAAEQARKGFSYPYGAMVLARHEAALIALERGWPASCPAWRAAIDAIAAHGELTELALTLRAAAALAQRAGDAESARLLLAAVPPGVHASVSGDLLPDPP